MLLLDLRQSGQFLSEALPHYFPIAGVSKIELILWEMYYDDKLKRQKLKRK